jgi:hypothetical protein
MLGWEDRLRRTAIMVQWVVVVILDNKINRSIQENGARIFKSIQLSGVKILPWG